MNITEVRIHKTKTEGSKIKAYASVTLEKEFVVTGIKITDGSNGLFVAMPSAKGGDGEFRDICYPITKEFREQLQMAVLSKYNEGEGDFHPVDDSDSELPF